MPEISVLGSRDREALMDVTSGFYCPRRVVGCRHVDVKHLGPDCWSIPGGLYRVASAPAALVVLCGDICGERWIRWVRA